MADSDSAKCLGKPGCTDTNLVESHIVPRGVARYTRGEHQNLILTPKQTKATPQLGETDWNLLCGGCDGELGRFDDVLIFAIRKFKRLHRNLGQIWALPNINADEFAKGLLAIAWRASISSRPAYRDVSLGDYEPMARDILFGGMPFGNAPGLGLLVQRYTSRYFDVTRFYTNPVMAPFMERKAMGFGVGGFRVIVKFDSETLPDWFNQFDLMKCGIIRGSYVEIERTPDFEGIANLMVADMRRGKRK